MTFARPIKRYKNVYYSLLVSLCTTLFNPLPANLFRLSVTHTHSHTLACLPIPPFTSSLLFSLSTFIHHLTTPSSSSINTSSSTPLSYPPPTTTELLFLTTCPTHTIPPHSFSSLHYTTVIRFCTHHPHTIILFNLFELIFLHLTLFSQSIISLTTHY